MTIGDRLKTLRKQRHLTLEDVSKSLDISRANINKYENGNISNIPSDRIEQLARFYDVSPAYLMGWEETEVPENATTCEARIISGGIDQMPKEKREQALKILQVAFTEYADLFKEENDNDTRL